MYLAAFFRLSGGRPVGMNLGAISWMMIEEYCDRIGVHQEQRELMHHHIGRMDKAYLDKKNAKAPGASNGNKGKNSK